MFVAKKRFIADTDSFGSSARPGAFLRCARNIADAINVFRLLFQGRDHRILSFSIIFH
jgi:hypothetical protein